MKQPVPNRASYVDTNCPVDQWCSDIATVYSNVRVSDYPMFRWSQFTNDVTILGEYVRRGEENYSRAQVARILGRLLDFVGAYLYRADVPEPNFRYDTKEGNWKAWASFSEFLAACLQMRSWSDLNLVVDEGLTRWILAKYPFVCAKCGVNPCNCVVWPWEFENRREDPDKYERHRRKVTTAHQKLEEERKARGIQCLTLDYLFEFFRDIYRNSYHHADPWKLVMHLAEEVGEATTELTRLELIFLAPINGFTQELVAHILQEWVVRQIGKSKDNMRGDAKAAKERIDKAFQGLSHELEMLRTPEGAAQLEKITNLTLQRSSLEDRYRIWFGLKTAEKLKEEIADVMSWLVAVGCKLSKTGSENGKPGSDVLDCFRNFYVDPSGVGPKRVRCRACGGHICNEKVKGMAEYSDSCLLFQSFGKELLEHIMKF